VSPTATKSKSVPLFHTVKEIRPANTRDEIPRIARIRFFSPSELQSYVPERDIALVGNCHVMRGETFLIGGEPGVGKSRGATSLAVAGATPGSTWFGLPVHRQFRTMIVQTENGRYRLQQEYRSLGCDKLDDWIRVSEPPPFGLTLTHPEFQEDIRAALESFKPDCVILDPWNAAAKDDKQRDYSETFDALRNLLPTGPEKPALGIVAHTRKPQANEKRTGGTGLMHILSGSYILTSVPRSIFVMVRGSDEETADSVVWCNPKNSNGPLAARTAWHRHESGFAPDNDFDWREFDKPPDKRVTVCLEHLAEVFEGGELELKEAAHALATLTGINERSAYNALAADGKFKANLKRKGNVISFT
jgi:RecA-superfamily ATPases implicated in signal transduction